MKNNRLYLWLIALWTNFLAKIGRKEEDDVKLPELNVKLPNLEGLKGLQERLGKAFGNLMPVTTVRVSKHAGSNNHNKKRNKVRAKMAANSNKLNRQRIKNWKY